MGTIGYGYGSEWHLLRYLGYHRDELSRQVLATTGGDAIRWLDHRFRGHLPGNGTNPLHADREWRGLDFIDEPAVQRAWQGYWPQTGSSQNWDAVAEVWLGGRWEWLLVEAKAHTGEVRSSCGATSPASLSRITTALRLTSEAFGSHRPVSDWLEPYYQTANRLAVLHFLTNVCRPPVPARVLFIYFYGDAVPGAENPSSPAEWQPTLTDIADRLGIDAPGTLSDRVHRVFLPVGSPLTDPTEP